MVSFNMFIEYNLVGHREDALKYFESVTKNPMMRKLSNWFTSKVTSEENKSVIYSEWNFPSIVGDVLATNMMEGVVKTIQSQEPKSIVTFKKIEPNV